jgi:hypothetical protein
MIIAGKSHQVSDPTIDSQIVAFQNESWVQPALSRTPARRNFCGSTASPSIRVS